MKEHPCDLCGSNDAAEIPHVLLYTNGQLVHVCRACGFVYVRARRSAKEIAETWNEIYGEGFAGERYTARIPAVKARHVYVADFLDMHLPLKSLCVCDIGAGEGAFLKVLRDEYGADVFGVEPSAENVRRMAAMGIEAFAGTIEEFAERGAPASFDVVTIVWTLENCQSCRGMLGAAHRLLRPGGHVLVATGSRILVPFKKTLMDYFGPNPADTHCFRFSANTLRTVLALNGFRAVHLNRYLDSDVLCAIGRREAPGTDLPRPKDDPNEVLAFFERWHAESEHYR